MLKDPPPEPPTIGKGDPFTVESILLILRFPNVQPGKMGAGKVAIGSQWTVTGIIPMACLFNDLGELLQGQVIQRFMND